MGMKRIALGFLIVGVLVLLPTIWSHHLGEIRTPRRYFLDCYNVAIPSDAILIKDQRRGGEFILIWKCNFDFIEQLRQNPPEGYDTKTWSKPIEDFIGPLIPSNYPGLKMIRSNKNSMFRFLGIDQESGLVIGCSLG